MKDGFSLGDEVKFQLHTKEHHLMNDFIQRIVNAIIRQEGEPEDSLNPMNLRGAPWLYHPIIDSKGFWRPTCRKEGIAGGAHLVALHIAQGNSVTDFIAGHPGVYAGFAPGADNNKPDVYIHNVCEWVVIPDATAPMYNYLA